jgi:hypothetical protein
MKIVTEPRAVETTIDGDAAGTVIHAAEVTQDVAEAKKESKPEQELEETELNGSEPEKTGKTETCVTKAGRPKEAAKKSDASHAIQAPRVFEDAEYFGAKFESFWNRLFSCYCAYDENSKFALPPNFVSFSVNFVPQLATMIHIPCFCDVIN